MPLIIDLSVIGILILAVTITLSVISYNNNSVSLVKRMMVKAENVLSTQRTSKQANTSYAQNVDKKSNLASNNNKKELEIDGIRVNSDKNAENSSEIILNKKLISESMQNDGNNRNQNLEASKSANINQQKIQAISKNQNTELKYNSESELTNITAIKTDLTASTATATTGKSASNKSYAPGQGGTHPGADPTENPPAGTLPVGDGSILMIVFAIAFALRKGLKTKLT